MGESRKQGGGLVANVIAVGAALAVVVVMGRYAGGGDYYAYAFGEMTAAALSAGFIVFVIGRAVPRAKALTQKHALPMTAALAVAGFLSLTGTWAAQDLVQDMEEFDAWVADAKEGGASLEELEALKGNHVAQASLVFKRTFDDALKTRYPAVMDDILNEYGVKYDRNSLLSQKIAVRLAVAASADLAGDTDRIYRELSRLSGEGALTYLVEDAGYEAGQAHRFADGLQAGAARKIPVAKEYWSAYNEAFEVRAEVIDYLLAHEDDWQVDADGAPVWLTETSRAGLVDLVEREERTLARWQEAENNLLGAMR